MRKLSIFALVALMVVSLGVLTAAEDYAEFNLDLEANEADLEITNSGDNYVKFFNKVKLDKGTIDLSQNADSRSYMLNDVKINGDGKLDFDQNLNTGYGRLVNNVELVGSNINFLNLASEKYRSSYWQDFDDDGYKEKVRGTRSIQFAQDFYVAMSEEEVNQDNVTFMDAVVDVKLKSSGDYITQYIESHNEKSSSTFLDAWNNDLESGQGQFGTFNKRKLPNEVGGKAFITADFESRNNMGDSDSLITFVNSSFIEGDYAKAKVIESGHTGGNNQFLVDVDNFSVSWNGDWS